MVREQYMQVIPDKTKYDPDWDKASRSYDLLHILVLIDKNFLAQTKDQYPFAVVY